jgi:hypothetical protein
MKIKVLRDYSGQEGTDVDKNVFAGSKHVVTRGRAAELKAVGLAEIIGDDPHTDDEEEDVEGAEKQIQPITNKAAPVPANKAAPKAADKEKGK